MKIKVLLLVCAVLTSCKKEKSERDTILTGKAELYVDETIFPIMEDQRDVFVNEYDAEISIKPLSEAQTINALLNGTANFAVMARSVTEAEQKAFTAKKINPRITPFATDAVAFIRNKKSVDTLLSLQDIVSFLEGKEVSGVKGLVFDNPNSSTVRAVSELLNVKIENQKGIFSFENSQEVIKYTAENDGLVGVVGLNQLLQPSVSMVEIVENVHILSVKGLQSNEFVYPSQDLITQKKYPLARRLYMINCQGYSGLGMGFASFVAGERGQRIVLKSGLVPERFPSRKLVTRKSI